jgi:D-alanine-D-alanine ligase-like ATP-grasp enzyme
MARPEDGAVRDVLELAKIPYVGARPAACRLAFVKPVAKRRNAAAGVATPASVRCRIQHFGIWASGVCLI